MVISYNWLCDYLPISEGETGTKYPPAIISNILTSVGLEVEKSFDYEEVRGGLKGLVIGKVLKAEPHPNADKLKLTLVDIGNGGPLQIVCGAPNVEEGQKVVVAKVGTTLYPTANEPLTMRVAKIRGVESNGMICAEDEIGLGESHAGILVLPEEAQVGMAANDYFKTYSDHIFEIGLTPNRMDAMSHWGVARDVCAYISHHEKRDYKPRIPEIELPSNNHSLNVEVEIENKDACKRYSGVCIANITAGTSPKWMQERLKAIGLRPINNIVDITNYIQYETGQPLHAFDYDQINGKKVLVKNLAEGTSFITLDEKERKLSSEDLMICSGGSDLEVQPMCIAGVFGGLNTGVSYTTTNIFLESAYFDPGSIRKTSFRHGLRTDAASRFEKGIDISKTVDVLKRAAALITQIAGGEVASDIIDIYPSPQPKEQVKLYFDYLKKLSGKVYDRKEVHQILTSLGFNIIENNDAYILVEVPYHKPDISLAADIVEEIIRIDGLDNIEIPVAITISPSVEDNYQALLQEKTSTFLIGSGYSEILTNSITNSTYFKEQNFPSVIRLLNTLSTELDVMRPHMLHTALEVISFNLSHKNQDLKFFEFGKTYNTSNNIEYKEQNHLCIYITGSIKENSWKGKGTAADIFYAKGMAKGILQLYGIPDVEFEVIDSNVTSSALQIKFEKSILAEVGKVNKELLSRFEIKQPVFFIDFNWDTLTASASNIKIQFEEVAKYPSVERDLAIIVSKDTPYQEIVKKIQKLHLKNLKEVRLFDIFQSEKFGNNNQSMAINFIFLDEQKTLTDKEIEVWMNKIITTLENEAGAEVRK